MRRNSGVVSAKTAANTTKNPKHASQNSAPLCRSNISAKSPKPKETAKINIAEIGFGDSAAWQFVHTTPESPAGVQSDFVGMCWLHCGQVMAELLPNEKWLRLGAQAGWGADEG
jgi:hypothetical protein